VAGMFEHGQRPENPWPMVSDLALGLFGSSNEEFLKRHEDVMRAVRDPSRMFNFPDPRQYVSSSSSDATPQFDNALSNVLGIVGAIGPMLRPTARYPRLIPALRNMSTGSLVVGKSINTTHPDILGTIPNGWKRLSEFEAGFVDDSGKFYSRTEAADRLLSKVGIAPGQGSRSSESANFDRLFPGLESLGNAEMYKWWNQASPTKREKLYNRVRKFVDESADLPVTKQTSDRRFPTLESGDSPFGQAADDLADELANDFGLRRDTGLEVIWQ